MQGFNMGRYVPPDLEGIISHNRASGKGHALGSRARKLATQGILTVRFEMPYAVWCSTCPKPTIIGQGVRFNAEKKKVGMYYSTPIWSFRMKHAACGGVIEIRTDPKTTRYVVVSGGKERDYGEDRLREGEDGRQILSAEEREKRREDAFAVLEDRVEDKKVEGDGKRRVEELLEDRQRFWEDPYEASRMVRKGFRRERKERVRERDKAEGIQARLGLGVELVPESHEDAQRAALVDYGDYKEDDAMARPLFKSKDGKNVDQKKRIVLDADRKRKLLEKQLRDNTRAARNPFGDEPATSTAARKLPGLDTTQADTRQMTSRLETAVTQVHTAQAEPAGQSSRSLVSYDSE